MADNKEGFPSAFLEKIDKNIPFCEFLKTISSLLHQKDFNVMRRFLYNIMSTKISEQLANSEDLLQSLCQSRCINEDELDLLEDMLGVTNKNDVIQMVVEFKKKRSSKLAYLGLDALAQGFCMEGRSVVYFFLKEDLDSFDRTKLLNFKKVLCKSLKLLQSEVSWIGKAWGAESKIIFQLPCDVVPFLRHCTAWKKDWLFGVGVNGLQVDSEDIIPVVDIRVSQLRLQEDPVLVSPFLRTNDASRIGDVSELRRVLTSVPFDKRSSLLNSRIEGATPLITASKNGNLAVVQCLVDEYGVDVEQEGTVKVEEDLIECCTALWMACLGGHIGIVRFLIEKRTEVNHSTLTSSTPLRAASFNGHAEVVRYLLANGANVNQKNQDGNTCVMVACWNGHLGTFALLRNSGADLTVKDNQGFGLVHCGTAANNLSLLNELLSEGGDVDAKTTDGITPLMLACEKNHSDVTLLLIQRGAKVNEQSSKGLTAVHFCALSNSQTSLQHLMDYDADLCVPTQRGSTSLMLACAKGYPSIVTALLRNIAKQRLKTECSKATEALESRKITHNHDINQGNENGETCLMLACERGSAEIVRILLDEGADPTVGDIKGVTPLLITCKRGHEKIVPLLLKKGAKVNVQEEEGNTPLHICTKFYREISGHRKCVELLLDAGSNLDIKNEEGLTPVMVALRTKVWFGHAVEAFYERGGDLVTSFTGENGDTAFHKCARSGDLLSMAFLMGAESRGPLLTNHDGDTALWAAALEGNDAMTRTLLNTLPGLSTQEKVEAFELLGVGFLAKDIARDWDTSSVVGFWQEAMALRKNSGLHVPYTQPCVFPLEYFIEARNALELEDYKTNASVLTAQALQICIRLLPRHNSRLPALLGTVGERFAQIGEFCRSLNVWLFVLDIQLENLSKGNAGIEELMNTFRCFADAFGFVLSRNAAILPYDIVYKVVQRALTSLTNFPAVFEVRDTLMPYLLHYFSSLLEISRSPRETTMTVDIVRAFVGLSLSSKENNSALLHIAVTSKTGDISSLKEHLHFPNLAVCELLVDCGVDIDALDSNHNTALHILLTKGHAELNILQYLLNAGSHVDARNSRGKTAIELSRCLKIRQEIRSCGIVSMLQCLAAQCIVNHKVTYQGFVARRLEPFIALH